MVWAKRLGLALVFALFGALILWIVAVLMTLLVEWLNQTIPIEWMLITAGLAFVALVVGDWVYDTMTKRDPPENPSL